MSNSIIIYIKLQLYVCLPLFMALYFYDPTNFKKVSLYLFVYFFVTWFMTSEPVHIVSYDRLMIKCVL